MMAVDFGYPSSEVAYECQACEGTGVPMGTSTEGTPCQVCQGTGRKVDDKCPENEVWNISLCGSCEYMYPDESGRVACSCMGELPDYCPNYRGTGKRGSE